MRNASIFTALLVFALFSALVAQPKEIREKRTHNSKTFINQDETMTTEIKLSPMHFTDKHGDLHEIDNTIRPSHTSYDYEVTSGLYNAYFKQDPRESLPVVFEAQGGATLQFGVQSLVYFNNVSKEHVLVEEAKTSTPVVNGNCITFPQAFTDADLKYYYKNTRLEEHIVFSQTARNRLPSPESKGLEARNTYVMFLSRIDFEKSLTAFVDQEKIQGKDAVESDQPVYFTNIKGQVEFFMPSDHAYLIKEYQNTQPDTLPDQGEAITMKRRFFRQGNDYYMLSGVPYTWLTGLESGTVLFDPQVEINFQPGSSIGKDAWICNYYANNNAGVQHRLQVEAIGTTYHSLIEFSELEQYINSNASVDSAKLSLYCYSLNGSGPVTINAYRVTNSWREGTGGTTWTGDANSSSIDGVTWNERWYGTNWNSAGGDYDPTAVGTTTLSAQGTWIELDITDVVQDWLDGTHDNYGLLLMTTAVDLWPRFYSSDWSASAYHPKLSVNYTTSSPRTTYYVRDAAGQVIATYEK